MKIIPIKSIRIEEVVRTLRAGGLVMLPTETLYGAMVDATNKDAVLKLTRYKNRPFGKPYSIAVTDKNMAKKYVHLNKTAENLYDKYLPGPLTIVSKGRGKVAAGVQAEDQTLGIRIPDYKLVLNVVKKLGKPITATSANASYKKRPYSVSDILDNISDKQKKLIDLIVDAGTLPNNDPSTVIDTTVDDPIVLRQGEIKFKGIDSVISRNEDATKNIAKELWQKYQVHKSKRSIVFALEGEMGSGKTIFTKGLALAMQIKDTVTSPSYVFEQEYGNKNNMLYHFDAWKMNSQKEIIELGIENLIKNKEVVSIEWADRVSETIREYDDEAIIIWVKIEYTKNINDRKISWGTL